MSSRFRFSMGDGPGSACVWALVLLAGCNGKVPTWNELTTKPPEQTANPTPNQTPAETPVQPPTAIVQTPVQPAKPDAATVIANFKQLKPGQIDNSALATLTSLDEGLDQITEIDATGGNVDNGGVGAIGKLTALKVLRLDGTKVDDKGCPAISQVPGLEELTLNGGMISDEGVEFLKNLTQLKILKLAYTKLSLTGWENIGSLPALEHILIENSSLDDASIDALCNANTLEKIDMRRTRVSDSGLQSLAKLDNLIWLDIGDCPVTGSQLGALMKSKSKKKKLVHLGVYATGLDERGVNAIAGMDTLEELSIGKLQGMTDQHLGKMLNGKKHLKILSFAANPGLSPACLGKVSGLKELETLDFSHVPAINDQSLVALKGLKKLRVIHYGGSAVTAVGIENLRKSIPDLNQQ